MNNIQVDDRGLELLIQSVQFAISNLDDLNEATDGGIKESDLEDLRDILEIKK